MSPEAIINVVRYHETRVNSRLVLLQWWLSLLLEMGSLSITSNRSRICIRCVGFPFNLCFDGSFPYSITDDYSLSGQSIYNFREFIQNIQFHHVPFLTTQILALIIPEMRKLQVLGVYNCELIHLCDGIELLHIIQRDRGRGCERQVSLDFYPAYHVGPQRTYQVGPKKGERKVGEQHAYGVSWDDTGMYVDSDTRIAIWQEVCTIIQLAREQGIDFESKHTMFRKWLDKSPCLAVEATLKVIMSPLSDVENVIAHVAYGEFGGRIDKFQKSKPGKVPNKPEGSQWYVFTSPIKMFRLAA